MLGSGLILKMGWKKILGDLLKEVNIETPSAMKHMQSMFTMAGGKGGARTRRAV